MASKKHENLLEKMVILGSSLVYLGKDVAEDLVGELEKRKLLAGDEGKKLAEKIKSEFKGKREKAQKTVLTQLRKVISELGIATKEDIEKLKQAKKNK